MGCYSLECPAHPKHTHVPTQPSNRGLDTTHVSPRAASCGLFDSHEGISIGQSSLQLYGEKERGTGGEGEKETRRANGVECEGVAITLKSSTRGFLLRGGDRMLSPPLRPVLSGE
jgi:hypothetical protein